MKGWVYVISTRTHNLVKVGYTERDPKSRAKELDGTSSPHPHVVEYAVLVENPLQLEQAVHRNLATCREGKEWFNCSIIEAVAAIKSMAGGTILFEDAPCELAEKIEAEKVRVVRSRQAQEVSRIDPELKMDSELDCSLADIVNSKSNLEGAAAAVDEGNSSSVGCVPLLVGIIICPPLLIPDLFDKRPIFFWVLLAMYWFFVLALV